MYLHFALLLVLLFGEALGEEGCTRNGASCPDYTVEAIYDDYEERAYPSLVWVSTSAKAKSRSMVSRSLMKKLYAYLGGENENGQRLQMMVPVRTTKFFGESQHTYTMAIGLAPEFQSNPPSATDRTVTVSTEPEKTYFVRSFGGMIRNESRWDEEEQALRNSLQGGTPVNISYYYWCVYDSPWREENRLNEVWLTPH